MTRSSDRGTVSLGRPGAPGDADAPATLGEYTLVRPLGAGGYGAVFEARHAVLGRRVAIKLMNAELAGSPEMLERFEREARTLSTLGHPSIVQVYDFGQTPDGRPYFVMEYLEGEPLDVYLEQRGRLSPAEAVGILAPLCQALAAAHERGIVHRDVKPGNVMIVTGAAGAAPTVKLLDFGIAKLLAPEASSGATTRGRQLGTPSSMSPEQIRGFGVDHRADVYGLGVLLHELLTGRPPFEATEIIEMERLHLEAPPQPPSRLAPAARGLDDVVLRCLAKQPAARWASTDELLAAARAAVAEAPVPGPLSEATARRGLALHVVAGGERADADAIVDALDALEPRWRAAGYTTLVADGRRVLAVRALPAAQVDDLDARRGLVALGLAVLDVVTTRVPGAAVAVSLHADALEMSAGGAGGSGGVTSGRLLDTPAWASTEAHGLFATTAILAGLDDVPLGAVVTPTLVRIATPR